MNQGPGMEKGKAGGHESRSAAETYNMMYVIVSQPSPPNTYLSFTSILMLLLHVILSRVLKKGCQGRREIQNEAED